MSTPLHPTVTQLPNGKWQWVAGRSGFATKESAEQDAYETLEVRRYNAGVFDERRRIKDAIEGRM